MNPQIYSREFLQGIPEENKQRSIDNIVNLFRIEIMNTAATGKTSYLCDFTMKMVESIKMRTNNLHVGSMMGVNQVVNNLISGLSNEDLIAGFQRNFPGCSITTEEVWEQTSVTKRTLKKGILIDWS